MTLLIKFFTYSFLIVLSLSVCKLHYSEAMENDGIHFYETEASEDHRESSTDNDNDNETLRVLLDLDMVKTYEFSVPHRASFGIPLPAYDNSYQFAFASESIRPPISLG